MRKWILLIFSLLTLSAREIELVDKVERNEPIPAHEWGTTISALDKRIKNNRGITVRNWNGDLMSIARECKTVRRIQ